MRTYHLIEYIEIVRQHALRIMASIANGTIKLS
jgi:hypothetical protein